MSLPLQHPVIRRNGRGRPAPAPDVGWRERLQALRHLPKLLRMVWETEPRYVVGILLLRVARSAVPLAVLWIGKLIVDEVVHAINLHHSGGPIPWSRLGLLIGIELAIALVGEGLSRVSALLESLLGDLFANRTSVQLMQHAATLDLEQFENAEIYDKLERARRQTVGRIGLFTMLLATLQDLITLVSLSVALAVYVPWLLVLLVVAVLPSLLGETHFASLGYSLLFSWTPERPHARLPPLHRRQRHLGQGAQALRALRFPGGPIRSAVAGVLRGQQGAVGPPEHRLHSALDRGDARLLRRVRRDHLSDCHESRVASRRVHHRRAHLPGGLLPPEPGSDPAGAALAGAGVRAESLSRGPVLVPGDRAQHPAQPGREAGAGAHPDRLCLRGGGVHAIPARSNGRYGTSTSLWRRASGSRWWARTAPARRPWSSCWPGSTTRTEGRILLDGVDLREYDLDSLRRNIGVIFQDFVRYDFLLKENIAVGNIGRIEDQPAIQTAAERSLADSVVQRVAGGFDQMLGKRFEGGVDLSGGEWQKVALARAYMRDAQLLILDEPTAALDARAEYEVFLRFSELTKGRMAVLISHRFSTVRMADRILVLKGGELVEQGTHEALVAAGWALLGAVPAPGGRVPVRFADSSADGQDVNLFHGEEQQW